MHTKKPKVKVLLFCYYCCHEWDDVLTEQEVKAISEFAGVRECPQCHKYIECPSFELNSDL